MKVNIFEGFDMDNRYNRHNRRKYSPSICIIDNYAVIYVSKIFKRLNARIDNTQRACLIFVVVVIHSTPSTRCAPPLRARP